jgi:hypothetical protein
MEGARFIDAESPADINGIVILSAPTMLYDVKSILITVSRGTLMARRYKTLSCRSIENLVGLPWLHDAVAWKRRYHREKMAPPYWIRINKACDTSGRCREPRLRHHFGSLPRRPPIHDVGRGPVTHGALAACICSPCPDDSTECHHRFAGMTKHSISFTIETRVHVPR